MILRYLDSPMAKVFRLSSGRNGESKLDQNIFQRSLKHTFSLLEYYLLGGGGGGGNWVQKAPKRNHLMDAELVQNTLKIYNLTAANAILMKLSTIRYLLETFNLAKD